MATPLIARDFQFTRDFRSIEWRSTLWYNLLRAFMAGCVLMVLFLIFPPQGGSRMVAFSYPFIWPFFYVLIVLPGALLLSILRYVPFVGLIGLFLGLIAVAIGDPLVCVLKKFAPQLVPVEETTLFSVAPVFWVLNAPEIAIAD